MPPTKSYHVRRLDSTDQEVTLLKKATGGECLDKVSVCGSVEEGKWSLSRAFGKLGSLAPVPF